MPHTFTTWTGPKGPPTEFANHCSGVERGVSPGGSTLSRAFVRRGGLFLVQRNLYRGSTGWVLHRSKLKANGGAQWCVASAWIKFWGYWGLANNWHDRGSLSVLGQCLQVDRGCRFGARPTLTKQQGEQPWFSADQGEQYWCLADARSDRDFQSTFFLIGRASWCSVDAHFDRRSLLVLDRRSSNKWSSVSKLTFYRRSLLALGRRSFR